MNDSLMTRQEPACLPATGAEPVILCVDDEANILQALKRLLRKEGYSILTAGSGEEGLNTLKENPNVQVVISDQRMPGMSGSEFLLQVKQRHPDMLRVILSGYAEASAIVEAINEGEVCHFLTKPWNEEELKATIRQCLAHYSLKLENRLLVEKIREQNQELQQFNDMLSDKVDVQAQSLKFSQEILDKLPLPVLGISEEGIIALCNEAARNSAVLGSFFLGETFSDLAPEHVSQKVNAVLQREVLEPMKQPWNEGQGGQAYITPLEATSGNRGCIVLLMEN